MGSVLRFCCANAGSAEVVTRNKAWEVEYFVSLMVKRQLDVDCSVFGAMQALSSCECNYCS